MRPSAPPLSEPPLGPFAAHAAQVAMALAVFGDLVDACGPLAWIRFEANAFAHHTAPGPRPSASAAAERERWLEEVFARHVERLATPAFLETFHGALRAFVEAPYVDPDHRVAARWAMAMTPEGALARGSAGRDAPALYVLFCAQAHALWPGPTDGPASG